MSVYFTNQKFLNTTPKTNRGFSLIEIVIGVVIVSMLVGVFYNVFSQGANISRRIRDLQLVRALDRQIFTRTKRKILNGSSIETLMDITELDLEVPEQTGFKLISATRNLKQEIVDEVEMIVIECILKYNVRAGTKTYENHWYLPVPADEPI
jgi:prepilin-type N-terminal cleavage/methylation domain-containing protein